VKYLRAAPLAVIEALAINYGISVLMLWLYAKAWWGCL
jgi:hypothetical protein